MRGLFPETDLLNALKETERGYPSRASVRTHPDDIGPNDTLGGLGCWCGRPQNHDWPMKDEGAPHPRYPE